MTSATAQKGKVPAAKKEKWSKTKKPDQNSNTKKFDGKKKGFVKKFDKNSGKKQVAEKEKKDPLTGKELKRERQKRENVNFEFEMTLKKMWATLRNSDNDKLRQENVKKILEKVKEEDKKLSDFAFAHDTTRVLQSCIQHGSHEQRRIIFEELKPRIHEMAKEKYAYHIVWKLIKYGERDIKDYCIENLGNVRKLVRSNVGQGVLEYAYNQFAQSKQRHDMIKTLYGKSYTRLSKMDPTMNLMDICIKNADFIETILTDFMEDLKSLTEKEVIKQTIAHRAFLDFFNLILGLLNSSDEKIKAKSKRLTEIRCELIEQLRASVIHMIHTPDGARVGLNCIWFGTAKDRKLIIKTIKEFHEKVATAEHGHLLFLGVFDSVDDTVTVKKSLVSNLIKSMETLMSDRFARKVFWYIVADRDRRAFLPDVIKFLEVGDASQTSKKPRQVKLGEIQSYAIPLILEWFSENIQKCVDDPALCPLMVATMKHSEHVFKDNENLLVTLQTALAKKISSGNYQTDKLHPLKNAHIPMSLKQLLNIDKDRSSDKFVSQIAAHATHEMENWISDNRGCFLVLQCLEVKDEKSSTVISEAIESKVKKTKKQIQASKGGQLLLQKLSDPNADLKRCTKDEVKTEIKMENDEPKAKRTKK